MSGFCFSSIPLPFAFRCRGGVYPPWSRAGGRVDPAPTPVMLRTNGAGNHPKKGEACLAPTPIAIGTTHEGSAPGPRRVGARHASPFARAGGAA